MMHTATVLKLVTTILDDKKDNCQQKIVNSVMWRELRRLMPSRKDYSSAITQSRK